MAQFVKMGLGGTGYMGRKESYLRSARKRAARRKILPGFPITTPFKNLEEVKAYLSGDKIVCLLCGKSYKDVSKHISKIHGFTPDQYREQYNIPWTYGIVSASTSQAYSSATVKRMEDGFVPPAKTGEAHSRMINANKRVAAFRYKTLPRHALTVAPDGAFETFTQRRSRLCTKRGTLEFKIVMGKRPQCSSDKMAKMAREYWTGRKQTEEHKAKRFKKINTTM